MVQIKPPFDGAIVCCLLIIAVTIGFMSFLVGVDEKMNESEIAAKAERLAVYCKDKPADAVCIVIKRTKP